MISLVFLWLQLAGLWHPFHVSVCDVVFNQEARAVQISQRIFLDDFEMTLNKHYGTNLVIDDEAMKEVRDSLIALYLGERLTIEIDGKSKKGHYLGSEFEEDGIWCYIEIEGVKKLRTIQVTSSILLDEFDDQANIVYFQSGEYEKSVKLDEKEPSIIFTVPGK